LFPWSKGEASRINLDKHVGAFLPILRHLLAAMFQRPTLVFLPALFLSGAAYGLFVGMAPLFGAKVLNWGEDTYASWSGQANLVAGIGGALVFGFMAEHWGARRMVVASHLATAAAAAIFLAIAADWGVPAVLIIAIFVFTALQVFGSVTTSAVAMRRCAPAVAATQFSLFMAVSNIGISLASASLGTLDRLGGFPAMVIALIGTGIIGAAFAYVAKVGR
ncbi:MAG TPA: MFS transporter, partial [Brevundimonas sp.]|nr:MFS transporter [Brevundimonas sp.]